MKKRTKKKILKFIKKFVKGFFKYIIFYPIKYFLFYLNKLIVFLYRAIRDVLTSRDLIKGKGLSDSKSSDSKKGNGKIKKKAEPKSFLEVEKVEGSFSKFKQKLYKNKSTIGIILGARGTGKSAIGMRILENFKAKTAKKIYAMGFKVDAIPKWIHVVSKVDEIKNDSVILIDEGGIEFNSRRSMSDSNNLLSQLLMVARHKDLSVIFITQNSSNLEINAIRQADYLILKSSSLLQKDFERKKIKDIYTKYDKKFKEHKDVLGITLIYADNYLGFVKNSLPSFWSEGASKGYK
jgi:hypothetical protein